MIRKISALVAGITISAAGAASEANDDAHPTSAYISAAIAAGLPKFVPKQGGGDAGIAAADAARKAAGSDAGITTMPAYTVREAKVPDEERILTYAGRAKVAMDRYLGPSDSLDRGLLNRYTLPELWKRIPILGRLPFVGTPVHMSNEDRGFDAGGANDTIPYPHPPPEEKE
jgi:hypothetical protein